MLSSSSVYSLFSDRVGLPPHNTPFPWVLMNSIGAAFLRPDALPDVNHMRGMQYQIVLNIIFWPEINEYSCTNLCVQLLHKTETLIYAVKSPFSRLLRHTWVKTAIANIYIHELLQQINRKKYMHVDWKTKSTTTEMYNNKKINFKTFEKIVNS